MSVSFWLEDIAPLPAREPLDGPCAVDVAIVGAGFTGLWTARELLRRDPSLSVLVCEARHVGFGASGRNGAWLSAGVALSPGQLARRSSPQRARETIEVMRDTVDQVVTACADEGIDAQIRRGGMLRVARGHHEVAALHAGLRAYEQIGVRDGLELLDADGLGRRVRIDDAQGALFSPHGAAIHPGRLVAGLADAVERRAGRIVESTVVRAVDPARRGRRAVVHTDRGDVTADAVVLATEAWLGSIAGQRRRLVPLYSLIVLTEPLDDRMWAELGWDQHELLSSHRYTVDYLSRTVDGRVLFGGRGAPYHFASSIEDRHDRHDGTHELLRSQLQSWFPALAGVRFTHAWGGPLGMPRDWSPNLWFDATQRVGGAHGYTGQGVATSNLAGRVLAEWILDGDTTFRDLPFVGHRSRRWEPEPLRWLAIRTLQRSVARIDRRAAQTGRPPTGRTLTERLLRH